MSTNNNETNITSNTKVFTLDKALIDTTIAKALQNMSEERFQECLNIVSEDVLEELMQKCMANSIRETDSMENQKTDNPVNLNSTNDPIAIKAIEQVEKAFKTIAKEMQKDVINFIQKNISITITDKMRISIEKILNEILPNRLEIHMTNSFTEMTASSGCCGFKNL